MQGLSLQMFSLPSLWWSRSSARESWGDVGCFIFPHIWCQSCQRVIQIEWGATYGSRAQVLCRPHIILPAQDSCAGGNLLVCLIAVSHSNRGEFRNKSIHSGLLVWYHIPRWIIVGHPITLCAHTRIAPSGFGGRSFFKSRQTKRALWRDRTLLMMSLMRLREPIGVHTSLG